MSYKAFKYQVEVPKQSRILNLEVKFPKILNVEDTRGA